jgi:hypothetical protein
MITKVLNKLIQARKGSRGNSRVKPGDRPIEITASEASEAVFCFTGEFGYEMISWIPYLLFLKNKLGIKLTTMSRPGSALFYYFSDEHLEADSKEIGDVWGAPSVYDGIRSRVAPRLLIHPGKDPVNRRVISVQGYRWTTRDIHQPIERTNYTAPDYSKINDPLPFGFYWPYVVINNKYFKQWHYEHPINYFDRASLIQVRELLWRYGYATVYNHFVEPTGTDTHLTLNDRGLFDSDRRAFDMRDGYGRSQSPGERNRVQMSVFNRAAFVIGPQGGNVYLPAICRKDLLILMRDGDYVDYQELSRLYGVQADVFYEPKHMVRWLEAELPKRVAADRGKRVRLRAAG